MTPQVERQKKEQPDFNEPRIASDGSLEFPCQNCNYTISIKYLKTGEIAKCKNCGAENVVPEANREAEI